METGKIYNGFKLDEIREVKEIGSKAFIFTHEKTGARLLKLFNQDDNKVFSIAFRTPPPDSTGVPHILEHSVLCGSRKFPTKEPFVELIKGSLNTFLNAFTFSDKTMYPVASKNEKDFFNLMDVYLDAVLYPRIYDEPEILMQEGWHYEIDKKEDPLTYKGVVYNEMRGAFSSPIRLVYSKIEESLFPDTCYGVESGGDPDFIPDLTYEDFIAFHKKYYHPSNSYIFLYGNGNIEKELEFINENYLKEFDALKVNSEISIQSPFKKPIEIMREYPISPKEDPKGKSFMSLGYVVGDAKDTERCLAFDMLYYMLLEIPGAPLKEALIKSGIGKDVIGFFDSSIRQPVFSVIIKNSDIESKEKFVSIVNDTLAELVSKGLDTELIEAAINHKEFELREAEENGYPKGLLYDMTLMETWLHDGHPLDRLAFEEPLSNIKKNYKSRYFENLIEEMLIKNNHRSLFILKPSNTLAEEQEKKIAEKLAKIKQGLNDKELEKIINQTKKLKDRQNAQDSPEALKSIPLLKREDINKKAETIEQIVEKHDDVIILKHPLKTNGITYLNVFFDTSSVPVDNIPYISLLAGYLGKLSTEKHSYSELANWINSKTGGIMIETRSFEKDMDDYKFTPRLIIKGKAISDKTETLSEIINEIILFTKFDEKSRMLEVIREIKSRLDMQINSNGHIMASRRLESYFSPQGAYNELLGGISYYHFISALEKNFENNFDEIADRIKQTAYLIFNKNHAIMSITAEKKDVDASRNVFDIIFKNIENTHNRIEDITFNVQNLNEGLLTPSQIQYVAQGYNINRKGYKYSGKLEVLGTVVRLDYLWNKVRVQGGAYGSMMKISRNGNLVFVSYRDPNLSETLEAYKGIPSYLKGFEADDRELTKYIIGTISNLDRHLTPEQKGETAATRYISGISDSDIQKERDEVLSITVSDIKGHEKMMEDILSENRICVLGGEAKIRSEKDKFDQLIEVFK